MLASFSFSGVMDVLADVMITMETDESSLTVPLRTSVFREENTLMLMPCLSTPDWGLKILSLYPGNPQKQKPFLNGVFLLLDGEDGHPSALLDGRTLTALRTGGVGGLAVRTLSDQDAARLGIAGTGVQGYWQVRFACSVRPFSMVTLHDTIFSKAQDFADQLKKDLPGTEIRVARDSTDLLESSDVVMTATNAQVPLFPDVPKLFEGKTFVGIGSYRPDMREYPDALFKVIPSIIVDTEHALSETGDLMDPLDSGVLKKEAVTPLGKILSGGSDLPAPGSGVFFKSVGFAAFDLAAARYLVKEGKTSGKGLELDL